MARQRGVELPLILSDHGDWDELTGIAEIGCRNCGSPMAARKLLLRWAALNDITARALELVGMRTKRYESLRPFA